MQKCHLFILLFLLAGCGYTQHQQPYDPSLMNEVVEAVAQNHIRPLPLDDSLSALVFDQFLSDLDPEENLFTPEDLQELTAHRYHIDEDIREGTNQFFLAADTRYQKRLKAATTEEAHSSGSSTEENYLKWVNAFLKAHDYQSAYMSRTQKDTWDAAFNRTQSIVGIGIEFQVGEEYPVLSRIYSDGPAWNTGAFQLGDQLMGMITGEQDYLDFEGKSAAEVSASLKGEAGSTLNLRVRHKDQQTADIEVVRDHFSLPRSMACVLSIEGIDQKMGYVRMPRFYAGEVGCANDLLAHLNYLSNEQVVGIVLDLRDNKGGSSREAIEAIGYFLEGEPVMQARYSGGREMFRTDPDPVAQYTGKLVVMVNERSASASELLSGTLQHYGRAIVTGKQTFGKGTIQQFVDLSPDSSGRDQGVLKLSIGSFFTGQGYSTQYRGVVPDIGLGREKQTGPTGERRVKNALHVDHLDGFVSQRDTALVADLQRMSDQRIDGKAYFEAAGENLEVPSLPWGEIIFEEGTSEATEKYWQDMFEQDDVLLENCLILRDYAVL